MLNKIYLRDTVDGLRGIVSNSVDIIIADPPYNVKKYFGNFGIDINEYVKWSMKWINECIRVLKNNGTMFIYGFSESLAYLFVNVNINKRWLVWHYTNKASPNLNFWQRSHESIIALWKDNMIFNRDDVREKYTDRFIKNSVGRVRNSTKGRFSNGNKETIYKAHEKGALPRDVIKISTLAGGSGRGERWFYCKDCSNTFFPKDINNHINHNIIKHPTQKPLKLTEKLILSCKPKNGGLVVIPFAGSGSEALVANKLEMDFIGFDINEDYVNMANCLIQTMKG